MQVGASVDVGRLSRVTVAAGEIPLMGDASGVILLWPAGGTVSYNIEYRR